MSAFENDPAVQAFRRWAYQAGRTINSGHYTSSAMQALMGPFLTKQIKKVLGPDVPGYYPGPLPYQPTGVIVNTASVRTIHGCSQVNGWAQNRSTHRPLRPFQVRRVDVQVIKSSGRWLTNSFQFVVGSCRGVTVRTQRW